MKCAVLAMMWALGGWSSAPIAADSALAYFGEHIIVAPGSAAARSVSQEFPARLKRKSKPAAQAPSVANVTVAVTMRSGEGTLRSQLCGKQSAESLTVCLDAGNLPEPEKLAALAFMSEPTVVLVATDAGRETFQHLLAGDARRSAHTEIRALDAALCNGECATRIQLVRK